MGLTGDQDWVFVRDNSSGAQWMVLFTLVSGVLAVAWDDPWMHAMFAFMAVFGALTAWNYRYLRLKVGPAGVYIRNPVRRRTFGWNDVSHFAVWPSLNGAANGPAIRLVLHDGRRMTAMAGTAWRRTGVAEDVGWLNDYARARSADRRRGV